MNEKDKIIAQLKTQVQTLLERIKELEEEIARLKKNSNNSSKPPSSDIVKPQRKVRKLACKKRRRGGQMKILHRRKELLPVEYFHLVFTLPEELREHFRSHQKILYGMVMKAAAKALIKLAADPKYVGGLIGVLAILHTWTRTLLYHPHVHCLVPAGGVSDDQEWLPARKNYLVPVKALSRIFRGMFREMVTAKLPDLMIPEVAWNKEWVIYCKPTVQGIDKVLDYLGRYVHRIAIANSRILSIDDGKVTFRYQNCGDSQWKTMTLPASEFIRRFLQHVLPRGTHKARYYGLWNPSNRSRLRQVQIILTRDNPVQPYEMNLPENKILGKRSQLLKTF